MWGSWEEWSKCAERVWKNSSRLPLLGKNVYITPVKWSVSFVEEGRQGPCDRLAVREDETPPPWASPLVSRDVQWSPRILFPTPLSECIVIEKRMQLRVRSASPPLYRYRYRSLLQNIVSFIGLFCKRDLSFNLPRYPRWARVVIVLDTARKSHPLLIISSGRNSALNWCSVKSVFSQNTVV